MASKTAKMATVACIVAGCLTFLVGIPFGYLGAIVRYYYGPDSVYATFDPDTCSTILGLPTCGYWVPESGAFLQYLTHEAPSFIGGWCLIGIFAASMSTADGAILAMGTVLSNNILRHFRCNCVTHDNLLKAARLSTIPFGVIAALIASTRPNQTGYLLIVAFDISLAAAVVPLFGCFYTKVPRPAAAFASTVTGVVVRIILEFTLPKVNFEFLIETDFALIAFDVMLDVMHSQWLTIFALVFSINRIPSSFSPTAGMSS